ncbi:YdcF family protein [Vibrio aestuarianus]|uniref:YdcF family protein n=1 Tax=Vibrio aestuarianus TaxID=28171 RepID=UPI00237CB70F|nr:YdcF family protein [Vibrio aestuarianus]MDE1263825.1 YdcF family protein [Vibrio aestuarianus]MDE1295753.1 YdcF family protein [Vibrio aestuarianus]
MNSEDTSNNNTKKIYVVLGKRLVADQLTLEGQSRVDRLVMALRCNEIDNSVIAFCGGVTKGQTVSEASAMYRYLVSQVDECSNQLGSLSNLFKRNRILLEESSTNTVENIENLAIELIKTGQLQTGNQLHVTFISSDYHLQRIFEIQQLMDEQGLLGTLKTRCEQSGLTVLVDYDINRHFVAQYPYQHLEAKLFLLCDELTTYRVYLEGVVGRSFERDLASVRHEPYCIANSALNRINALIQQNEKWSFLVSIIPLLRECIEATHCEQSLQVIEPYLVIFDTHLTLLNRWFDPEQSHAGRWWR